jgi:hypothetical protein
MYYLIKGLCPRTDIDMGAHGISIDLHPKWKELVAESGLDQAKCNKAIETMGNERLDACGYSKTVKYNDGPLHRLYEARTSICVSWGEWGTNHITVPGDACGLDVGHGFGNILGPGGASLLPHNVDSWSQVQLLLIVFTWFAESVVLASYGKVKT